jgi:hypothetical protein
MPFLAPKIFPVKRGRPRFLPAHPAVPRLVEREFPAGLLRLPVLLPAVLRADHFPVMRVRRGLRLEHNNSFPPSFIRSFFKFARSPPMN